MTDSGLPDCELQSDSQVPLETEGVLEEKRCRGAGEMGSWEGIRGRI
jgi:hypothetical protein